MVRVFVSIVWGSLGLAFERRRNPTPLVAIRLLSLGQPFLPERMAMIPRQKRVRRRLWISMSPVFVWRAAPSLWRLPVFVFRRYRVEAAVSERRQPVSEDSVSMVSPGSASSVFLWSVLDLRLERAASARIQRRGEKFYAAFDRVMSWLRKESPHS